MITLYLDFDGVILDTITISNNYLKDNNITNEEEIHNYFENLDWRDLMNRSHIINNAIENIWKIYESGLFKIGIITHYNSIQEVMLKNKFITDNLPNDIVVHYVHHSNKKNSKVDAYNAVLVDDYIKNIVSWELDEPVTVARAVTRTVSKTVLAVILPAGVMVAKGSYSSSRDQVICLAVRGFPVVVSRIRKFLDFPEKRV